MARILSAQRADAPLPLNRREIHFHYKAWALELPVRSGILGSFQPEFHTSPPSPSSLYGLG
jgi:hypothetical protein